MLQRIINYCFIIGLIWAPMAMADNSPALRIKPSTIELPEAGQHQVLQRTLAVKNTGGNNLNVTLRPSCTCLQLIPTTLTVAPLHIRQVRVIFDTEDAVGSVTEYIFIDSNDPVNPHITVVVEGRVGVSRKDAKTQGTNPVVENKGNTRNIVQPAPIAAQAFLPVRSVTVHSNIVQPVCHISIFSSPNCRYCQRLKTRAANVGKQYGVTINLREYYVNQPEVYQQLLLLEQQSGTSSTELPVVFVGRKMLAGRQQINEGLEPAIKECVRTGGCKGIKLPVAPVLKQTAAVSLLPVLFAGLLDGINPCAFATVVFLLSYLALTGRSRRQILISGISFTLAVFLAYLLIGIGLLQVFSILKFRLIHYLIATAAMVLGILSLVDYFRLKQGKPMEDMLLKLPWLMSIKIHQSVHKYIGPGRGIFTPFVLGFLISVFEFSCTGQIYVPTLLYMLGIPGLKSTGFRYLVFYNLMFILPLVVVFLLGYLGVSSRRLSGFLQRHVAMVKLITAVFFIVMGVLLLL